MLGRAKGIELGLQLSNFQPRRLGLGAGRVPGLFAFLLLGFHLTQVRALGRPKRRGRRGDAREQAQGQQHRSGLGAAEHASDLDEFGRCWNGAPPRPSA